MFIYKPLLTKIITLSLWTFLNPISLFPQGETKLGDWQNVESFHINETEDVLILAININGKGKLFITKKVVFGWTELNELNAINSFENGTADIGGPFLSADGRKLFFHANYSSSKGGYDIYYSKLTPKGWSKPINMGSPINDTKNQWYPSITPGMDKMYFTTNYATDYDFKKPKTSPACQRICETYKTPDNKWIQPYAVHQEINSGCTYSAVIADDGQTLYYSKVNAAERKLGFQLSAARQYQQGMWQLPEYIKVNEELKGDMLNPRFANGNVYFIHSYYEKKQPIKEILYKKVDERFYPQKTISSTGKIVTKKTETPIEASITVFNPTSLNVIARYKSDKHTGEFNLRLLDEKNYLIDIRKFGYSFASFNIDYRMANKIKLPETIYLFDTIELRLNVFDSEIFSPLEVQTTAFTLDETQKFTGKKVENGVYAFKLPLGSNYKIQAFADWFDQNEMLLKLEGDIVYSQFERHLPLKPQKNIFSIVTTDSETGVVFVADGYLVNLTSDEPPIFFTANDVDENGNININLRKGDKYELTLNKSGYFFHSQVIDLQNTENSSDSLPVPILQNSGAFMLNIKMDSLREDKTITLNSINFASNSYTLSEASFKELNHVVEVIKNNPEIVIEISAHTDNVGSKYFNDKLSEKRAQSVVNYLRENQVAPEQLVAKGYGFSQPKVPNDTEEHRAINRRVEFKVIKTEENTIN